MLNRSRAVQRIATQCIIGFFLLSIFPCNINALEVVNTHKHPNCYAESVYAELMRAISIIQSGAGDVEKFESDPSVTVSPRLLQEEEDYGNGEGGLEIPPIVPMIFKIVGSALSLNSSGVTENSFGFIPSRLSSQLTSVLGSLANSILGPARPSTPRPPPRRRRRSTTTTMAPSTTTTKSADASTDAPNSGSVEVDSEPFSVSPESITTVASLNETAGEAEVKNATSEMEMGPTSTTVMTTTLPTSTTTDVLFKESSLGELPVYAAAYAPNYVATTPYPVYASNFLHVLYPAPTTTTTPTTTSTDPNSYNVALPFDYEVRETMVISSTSSSTSPNSTPDAVTFDPNIATTPATDYEEYEYEERTEENAAVAGTRTEDEEKDKNQKKLGALTETGSGDAQRIKNQAEDEDDEYLDNDSTKNRSLSSLGRISRYIVL